MARGIRKNTTSAIAAAGALLVVFGLGACSAKEPVSNVPYAAEFEQARQNAKSDFQREVLSDNVITDEEFREVRQQYIGCLADAGIKATANPNGQYDFDVAPTGAQEEAEQKCSDETTRSIEGLYSALKVNPENEDFSALAAECLRSRGVVGDAFTKKDWDQFVGALSAAQSAATNADGEVPLSKDIPNLPTLPGGVAMDDPRVQQCSNNPLGK